MAYTVISAGGLNFAVFSDTNPVAGPIFTSTPVETGNSGEFYTYTAAATDPNDQELTYSLVSPPDGMTINQWTGKISWVPDDDDIGENPITVRVTDEDSLTADQTFTLTIGAFTGTDIDGEWLAADGSAPYYLDTASETYRLLVDVTTNGTAFAIIANNVTLNLNGHTVTYDNMTPIAVANHSFEDGTGGAADNWVFTNAPHGTRNEGVWLQNQCYDGDYAIKFTGWTGDEYIESSGTVTLPANTPIALTWMGYNNPANWTSGCYCYCNLVSQDVGGTDRTSSYSTGSYRGIQLNVLAFTTGETEETYKIRVGAVNPSGTGYTPYIDDIKIVRNRAYGVVCPTYYHAANYVPDISSYGNAYDACVCNGTITQGQDSGYSCHAVATVERRNTATVYDVTATVSGSNAYCIGRLVSSRYCIEQCDLTSNSITISSRDNKMGYVINSYARADNGEVICDNTINNGPQGGILACGHIAGNTIKLKGRYTNNFAIDCVHGSVIHNNVVDCGAGEYNARGLLVEANTSSTQTKVYNNTVTVQALKNNQESQGWQAKGAYGIQLDTAANAEVYNNTITAIADVAPAVGLRFTNLATATSVNLSVHDNTFTATRTGSGAEIIATALSSTNAKSPAEISVEDNDFITNSRYWFDEVAPYYSDYTLTRNTWRLTGDTTGFVAFSLSNCDMICVDNAYYDAASETAWDEGTLGVDATLDMQTT